jgi:hypothetical protein
VRPAAAGVVHEAFRLSTGAASRACGIDHRGCPIAAQAAATKILGAAGAKLPTLIITVARRLRNSVMSDPARGAAGTFFAAAMTIAGLAGCAALPHVAPTQAAGAGTPIQVSGSLGPLSEREAQVIVARLAASAPNAGALERHLAIEQAVAESTLYTGNRVRVLQNGDETFPAMFAAIRGAQHYVYLEYYIFEDVSSDGVLLSDLLLAKRQAGVEIDVIYDAVGSISTPADFLARLQSAGVRIVQFNPLNPLKAKARYSINDRDHRKMLIADGRVVILGGINLSASYESAPGARPAKAAVPPRAAVGGKPQESWRDIDVEISGTLGSAAPRASRRSTRSGAHRTTRRRGSTHHWQQSGPTDSALLCDCAVRHP